LSMPPQQLFSSSMAERSFLDTPLGYLYYIPQGGILSRGCRENSKKFPSGNFRRENVTGFCF